MTLAVHGHAPVTAVADEDMERSNDDKTAAVHFLRFELDPAMIASWNTGAPITLASALPAMPVEVTLTPEQRCMLAALCCLPVMEIGASGLRGPISVSSRRFPPS